MFTGIIEKMALVRELTPSRGNLNILLENPFDEKLKINQSITHNGVCLTVVETNKKNYTVTAVSESLQRSNLGGVKIGDLVNVERSIKLGDRLDGHIVQGHVDLTVQIENIEKKEGSSLFRFRYENPNHITVKKGSITVNGVSLTVVESEREAFSTCIIPYTYKNTNFHNLKPGQQVNIEFDILGKYITRLFNQNFSLQKEYLM
ncbi:MAG: riboflavin synthase [Flavobacteriales bacterium Tduv]